MHLHLVDNYINGAILYDETIRQTLTDGAPFIQAVTDAGIIPGIKVDGGAEAMKDDKQKCIDAGANDYITKPIDIDRLLSLMRVWLSNYNSSFKK